MTREKAIVLFEEQLTAAQVVLNSGFGSNPGENDSLYRRRKEMAEIALSALRPVSREQVEKVWRGEWDYPTCEWNLPKCPKCGCNSKDAMYGHKNNFCPRCGEAMTDEAVDMVVRRLEALHEISPST